MLDVVRALHPAVEIREACTDDLSGLIRALRQPRFFADRLQRQQADRGVLIAAWAAGQAIGAVYLWLEDAEEPEIFEHLPGVPLLTHLEVVPGYRNRDVGTMLINATEQIAAERGHDRLGLAVSVRNHDAERLYLRLGYFHWSHGPVLCFDRVPRPDGTVKLRGEVCHVLVKTLEDQNQQLSACHDALLVRW